LLRDDRPAERCRSVMGGWLDWLDTRLSPDGAQQGTAQRAWSIGQLIFTMGLALFIQFWPSRSNGLPAMRLILAARR